MFTLETHKPQIDHVTTIKDESIKTAVLNIVFSLNNDYMAVSYDNQKVGREEDDAGKTKEGSFVKIYSNRESTLARANTQSADSKNIFTHFDEIRNATQNQTFSNKHR